jgi:hypothetical protein
MGSGTDITGGTGSAFSWGDGAAREVPQFSQKVAPAAFSNLHTGQGDRLDAWGTGAGAGGSAGTSLFPQLSQNIAPGMIG